MIMPMNITQRRNDFQAKLSKYGSTEKSYQNIGTNIQKKKNIGTNIYTKGLLCLI